MTSIVCANARSYRAEADECLALEAREKTPADKKAVPSPAPTPTATPRSLPGVSAHNGGVGTIGEYRELLPKLQNEEAEAGKAALRFHDVAAKLADRHEAAAADYAAKAASAESSAQRVASDPAEASRRPITGTPAEGDQGGPPAAGAFPAQANALAGGRGAPSGPEPAARPSGAVRAPTGELSPALNPAAAGESFSTSKISSKSDRTESARIRTRYVAPDAKPDAPAGRGREAARKRLADELRRALLEKPGTGGGDGPDGPRSGGESAVASLLGGQGSAAAAAGAGAPLDSEGRKLPEFAMSASETDAQVRALLASNDKREGISELESEPLFERVHGAHERWQRVKRPR